MNLDCWTWRLQIIHCGAVVAGEAARPIASSLGTNQKPGQC